MIYKPNPFRPASRAGRILMYASSFILLQSPAIAGTGSGQITNYIGQSNGIVFFNLANRSDVPSCATAFPNRWALDATTPAGAALLSAILSAYSLKREISIQGSGNCGLGYSTEAVTYVVMP